MKKIIVYPLLGVFFIVLVIELALRIAGIVDFPVYDVDDEIGYVPSPDQSGRFLNKNSWVINEKSMGNEAWLPNEENDLLLLGDSIVWGGNPVDQKDKLAPQLESQLPSWRVWSAAAGSWAVPNAITWLDRNNDVLLETDILVWILNTGDLGQRSQWASEFTHPRSRPLSALAYTFQKYALPRFLSVIESATASSRSRILDSSAQALKQRLAEISGKRVLIVLYPDVKELNEPSEHYLRFREVLEKAMDGCCETMELRQSSRWKASLYRDGIHPSPEGYHILSQLLADELGLRESLNK